MPDERIDEMNRYYRARAPWHDEYMSYSDNVQMEALLAPIIGWVEEYVKERDVLEIACGTGNWTQVLAGRARSVLATDVADSIVAIARKKRYTNKVVFQAADAYGLEGIGENFTAAFAADWFSHIPKSRVVAFLKLLHTKLENRANVVFVDMLWRDHPDLVGYRRDEDGNLYHKRRLPDGQEFDVIKNYPTSLELFEYLRGIGGDIEYREHQGLLRWFLAYRKI